MWVAVYGTLETELMIFDDKSFAVEGDNSTCMASDAVRHIAAPGALKASMDKCLSDSLFL